MITVLDQYEVEYKESYISGSYDQVVMGRMFYKVQQGGIKKYFYGNRGVVYGNINSQYAPIPGTGELDASDSASYRLQPYREKAGNCKSVKHVCNEERIYDTLLPEVFSCFKINDAQPTILTGSATENPGLIPPAVPYSPWTVNPMSSIDVNNAFLMFNNYTTKTSYSRSKLNVIVDNTWTSSFPFEPRYSKVIRTAHQNFTKIKVKYKTIFSSSAPLPPGPYVQSIPTKVQPSRPGIIFGTVGPKATWIGAFTTNPKETIYHHWFSDSSFSKTQTVTFLGDRKVTGSLSYTDNMKVLYGFGDGMTIHYDKQFEDPNDPTGYQRRGAKSLPTFRESNNTTYYSGIINAYEVDATGSVWNTSPIIRGWKYGIYNGLPEYTNAYYRQGHYGQFRDMLEQRTYTCIFNEKQQKMHEPVVNIKFLDQDESLTNPVNTDSQNLSMFATSSLPFFDLTQRNRPENTLYLKNLSLIKLNFDKNTNLII